MPQQDLSSPENRLDNLSNMEFFRAYAQLRHYIHQGEYNDMLAHFLRGYCASLEEDIAKRLGLPQTTLVGRLVDLGTKLCVGTGDQHRDGPNEG